jgi:hypothetical protein
MIAIDSYLPVHPFAGKTFCEIKMLTLHSLEAPAGIHGGFEKHIHPLMLVKS